MERRVLREPTSGPNSRLTGKLIDDFATLLRRGLPPDGVCDYLFVDHAVMWRWLKQGHNYIKADNSPKEHAIYGDFVRKLRGALAQYRLTLLDDLHSNDPKAFRKWRRALAILERRDPKNFGRTLEQEEQDTSYDPDERFV